MHKIIPHNAVTAAPTPTSGAPFLTLMVLGSQEALVGSDIILLCSFRIYPSMDARQLTASWSKDGLQKFFQNTTYNYSTDSGTIEKHLKGGIVSLRLRNLTLEDAGKYKCDVQHDTLRATKTVTLKILERGTAKRATDLTPAVCRLKTPAGSSGPDKLLSKDVFLKCLFEADTMPIKLWGLSVSWKHNGKSLVEFRHGELVVHDPRALLSPAELEKGNVSLTLTNVTLTDGGKYISVIQYGVSKVQCGYTLTVQEQQNRIDIELLSAPVHAAQENQMGLESRSAPEHAGDGDPMGQKGDGPSTKHRTLKIGMVMGVLVGAWCVAFLIFFCYKP
ncbi:uncharacterized protein LOC121397920 isoform X2 [Xenopus laevis]|uniref:Uncharacterized protein LOC121397920 isoform X2 n=1 Tax=Xenopus laevis TaxID=8355 RepID=A0A8J1LS41_XENLA|nr:uncharacterized protein LOC121397920 isoform X2 [Xenopus laevis]